MKARLAFAAFALALALAGCGRREATKGGLSAVEERRLDNAAKMLDEQMGNLTFDTSPDAEGANVAEVEAIDAAAARNGAAGNSSRGASGNRQ